MSDREILVRWLASVAARLRRRAQLHELSQLACALLALLFVWQALAAAGLPAPVRSALLPLFLLAAFASTAWFSWRVSRTPTLGHAAAEADASAGLQDEIKSAHWFAAGREREGEERAEALVGLLLARAAGTAKRLDTRQLIPVRLPRSALGALGLAAGTSGLIVLTPPIALSSAPAVATTVEGPVRIASRVELSAALPAEPLSVQTIAPEPMQQDERQAAERAMDGPMQTNVPADQQGAQDATAASDAKLAGQAAQAGASAEAPRTVNLSKLDISALVQAGMAEAGQEAPMEPGAAPREPPTGSFATPSARMTREMREQIREERRKLEGTPTGGDVQFNPRMRAIRRSSNGANELVQAQGQAADAGAQTSVDGEAKGSPEGKSKAGGTSGEHPESSQVSAMDTQPVLGEPTMPLALQAEYAPVDRASELRQGAAKESFYAATRRRAAQAGYQTVDARVSMQREAALSPGDTPLSYREAVKRYFLTQHAGKD